MQSGIRVARPPFKPLLVFDGDCNFCMLWIRRWQQMTGDAVEYLPAQDPAILAQFPEIPREDFDTAVQLIEPDGSVYSGAEAVFRTLAANPNRQWPLQVYQQSDGIADFTEWVYGFIAGHRTFFSRLTRWFWGRHVEQPAYFKVRSAFLTALGAIYLIAFASLWMQIGGLIGHNGILPTDQFMAAARQQCDQQGIALGRYYLLPTLCWINSSDCFLRFQCAAGAGLSLLLIFRIAPALCLALLWLLYLSLVTVGRDFLGFQWDNLLLETSFLAIFFAPWRWLAYSQSDAPPSRIALWLLRLLLFKLVFSSGCVKLASGDPAWRHLTALTFHYYTQPLPTWIGWYANQLPAWFQKISCAVMFGIELGAPWLLFGPRRIRFTGAAAIATLQILILLTGNYTFFNWLTLALCLLWLDDFALNRFIPAKLRRPAVPAIHHPPPVTRRSWPRIVTVPLAAVVGAVYLLQVWMAMGRQPGWLFPAALADVWLSPLRTFSGYGLFAVMTTERHEIVVEGSNDGANWFAYEFKYKPGELNRRPAFVAPHQPRLDWQMWFAALGDYRQNPWFVDFCQRLLQGSPEVLALLEKNPFPDKPPRYIRAQLYDYYFTTADERRATGQWWKRRLIGQYFPPVSLPDFAPPGGG